MTRPLVFKEDCGLNAAQRWQHLTTDAVDYYRSPQGLQFGTHQCGL